MQIFSNFKQFLLQTRENHRVFLFYFRKYRRFYIFGIFSLVVVDGLEVLPPLLLKTAVDEVMSKPYGPELRSLLLKVVAMYMAVALVQGFMRYLWRKFIIRTSMFASHDMRNELFIHLTTMAPGFFQKKRVGDLVSLSTNDIEAVRFSLGPGALLLFDCLFYFLAIPPIMFWISPELTLLAFLPLLFVPIFVKKMERIIQNKFREVQDRFSVLASDCQEALGGVRIVKGSALEGLKERAFEKRGLQYQQASIESAKTQSQLTTGLEAILSASTTLLFLVGGAYVIGEKISLGVFVAFQRYIQKMSWPMEGIGLASNIFQKSIASQKRVDEVMLQKAGILDPPDIKRIKADTPAIRVENLNFTYPGSSRASLSGISFNLPAGKKLGITGQVGSGKSCLLSCLARTLPATPGEIFFDEIDVTELPFSEVRKKIAYVTQENFLFSRTIEDNILYGSEDFFLPLGPSRTLSATKAALLAAVHEEIDRLPMGYASILGERGTNLSGGQRQRISIARAIARKPKILFLDDCMSAIDSETENKLVDGILVASQGISLVIASHRISSFRNLDWVIFLQDGKIAFQGTPESVLRNNPTVLKLHKEEEFERMNLLT